MTSRAAHDRVLIALVIVALLYMVGMTARSLWPEHPPEADARVVARPNTAAWGGGSRKRARKKSPSIAPREAPGLSRKQILSADLSLREAMFYEKLPGKKVRCRLCPSLCVLRNGERGACRARANIDGILRTLVYGRLVAVNSDPIEKKPLNHFLPGTRALSIATAGCNLGCVFCQNWQISQAFPEKARHTRATPEQVVAAAKQQGCDTIAYTYTEPTIFYEFMLDTARLARKEGLKNVWITCGYINPEPLKELCKVMDGANIDLKGFSEEFYRTYCHASLDPVLETLKQARKAGMWIEVTNLIIPGANDDPKDIRALCEWHLKNLGADVPLHFSRFFPRYRLLDKSPTPSATLRKALRIAKEVGIHHVYIGNIATQVGRDTVCPKCGHVCIERHGYFVRRNDLKNGRCPKCGEKIAGLWK